MKQNPKALLVLDRLAGSFDFEVSALKCDHQPTAVLSMSAGDGTQLGAAQRAEMLAKVRAGEAVTLDVTARTFVQRSGPNRNFVRMRDGLLQRLARSFRGVPFLRDHEPSIAARGGTVTESALAREPEGEEVVAAFHQTIRATMPWAVEGFLAGTIDRFSIAWRNSGVLLCTVCKQDFRKCEHWPGETYAVDGVDKVAEVEVQDAEGIETSGVVVPAVVGTGIEDVRAALAAVREARGKPRREAPMDELKKLLAALGLDESLAANPAAAYAAITEASAVSGSKLAAESAARAELATRVASLEAAVVTGAKERLAVSVEAQVERAVREGRIALAHDDKGVRVASPIETALRDMGNRLGVEALASYVDGLPADPARTRRLSSESKDPAPRAAAAAVGDDMAEKLSSALGVKVTPTMRAAWKKIGVSEESILKYGHSAPVEEEV